MQIEGKTDKRKNMITFLSDDFSAPARVAYGISNVRSTNQNILLYLWFNLGLTHQMWEVNPLCPSVTIR